MQSLHHNRHHVRPVGAEEQRRHDGHATEQVALDVVPVPRNVNVKENHLEQPTQQFTKQRGQDLPKGFAPCAPKVWQHADGPWSWFEIGGLAHCIEDNQNR